MHNYLLHTYASFQFKGRIRQQLKRCSWRFASQKYVWALAVYDQNTECMNNIKTTKNWHADSFNCANEEDWQRVFISVESSRSGWWNVKRPHHCNSWIESKPQRIDKLTVSIVQMQKTGKGSVSQLHPQGNGWWNVKRPRHCNSCRDNSN